jgi:hypothetical protein
MREYSNIQNLKGHIENPWRKLVAISTLSFTVACASLWLPHAAHAQRSEPYPSTIESRSAGPQERIDVLGERFVPPAAVASSQSRIVLYRPDDARPGATSIFLNDRYHASLVPGSWSQLCYASGPAELATRQMQAASRAAKDRYDAISALTLQAGQVIYLRVDLNNAQPELRPVPAAQALSEIASTREQLHTVSRVAQACMEVTAPAAPAPAAAAPMPVQTYTLPADTLFAFDRSDRDAMTDNGTRAIDSLLARLAQDSAASTACTSLATPTPWAGPSATSAWPSSVHRPCVITSPAPASFKRPSPPKAAAPASPWCALVAALQLPRPLPATNPTAV